MTKRFSNLILIAAVAALAACGHKDEQAKTPPPTDLPSDVQSVATATAVTPVTPVGSNGETSAAASPSGSLESTGEFIAPQTSELAPKNPGRVARILADAGERVTAGQPLLVLESDYASLDAQRASAEVARAAAQAEDARRDFERKSELRGKGSIPQAAFDRSQAAYEQSRAAHTAAVAGASAARQRVSDSTLRAPFTGVVVERRADAGERLGDSSVAFVIAQTAPLKLRFDVPERYIATVRRGQRVSAFVDAYPAAPFEGKVSVVSQVINSSTRSFFVEAEFPNRDGRLRPGMFARVKLEM